LTTSIPIQLFQLLLIINARPCYLFLIASS